MCGTTEVVRTLSGAVRQLSCFQNVILTRREMCVKRYFEGRRITTVALESNEYYIFRVCVCSLRYPTCDAHALCYIAVGGLLAPRYFSILAHKLHDVKKKIQYNVNVLMISKT
jgi:hypothetical protein